VKLIKKTPSEAVAYKLNELIELINRLNQPSVCTVQCEDIKEWGCYNRVVIDFGEKLCFEKEKVVAVPEFGVSFKEA
jgi:hypothetical protein